MKYFIVIFFLPFGLNAQDNDWELKKDEDSITIYTRSVENSKIDEFKASTRIRTTPGTIFDILNDVKNYPKWIQDVNYAEQIYHRENEIGMYYQLGMPWPFKDRDITLISKYEIFPDNSILFQLSYSPDLKEENDDFLRIKEIKGEWFIKALDPENCEVTYRFMADPGGAIPGWVVNIFIIEGPFKTLQNLVKVAETGNYATDNKN